MEWRKNVHNKNLKSIYVYTSYVKSPNNNNRHSGHEHICPRPHHHIGMVKTRKMYYRLHNVRSSYI